MTVNACGEQLQGHVAGVCPPEIRSPVPVDSQVPGCDPPHHQTTRARENRLESGVVGDPTEKLKFRASG